MGLSGSKHGGSGTSPSSGGALRRCRVLKPSCFRSHRYDNDESQITDSPNEDNGMNVSCCSSESKSSLHQVSNECNSTDEVVQSSDGNCVNSDVQLCETSLTNALSEEGNTSMDFSSRSQNPLTRFPSRIGFYPGNLSFCLIRVNSLVFRRSNPASSAGFAISSEREDCGSPSGDLVARDDRPRHCDFLPGCFTKRPSRMQDENCVSELSCEDNQPSDSEHNGLRNVNGARADCSPNLCSPIHHISSDAAGIRHSERRVSTREPAEHNIQFSRTLSVGRLRDRVLRRSSGVDMDWYHFQQNREERLTQHGSGHAEVAAATGVDNFSQQVLSDNMPSSFPETFYGSHNCGLDTPRSRETRYSNLLEHRLNFVERRRRIRSQVRALQRLGNRFENMSGHERSCILSGQHRGGHCTCCIAAGETNSNDDANGRARISRIVMLAEALFEVLDEIHQQSVVLSCRTSVSPAPNEAVDSLPLKTFSILKRKPSDEPAQCYICLVEYAEGDSIRTLPCHHEFHRGCADKWLKEIHRVCPLCRGDICRAE